MRLVAIVPLNRIDPDPSELTEEIAEATLASYLSLWHPKLLNDFETVPEVDFADSAIQPHKDDLVVVPEQCRDYLHYDWEIQAETAGARLIHTENNSDRAIEELRSAADLGDVDAEYIKELRAIGLAKLWMEMLVQYMGHMTLLDEDVFRREILAASAAAISNDQTTFNLHLDGAYEQLYESRQQVYPVDIHFLDLCLIHPEVGIEGLADQLQRTHPVNLMLSGSTAQHLAAHYPEPTDRIRQAIEQGRLDIIGGEFDEKECTLLPAESLIGEFARGERAYRESLGARPTIFGRRRFGMARHVFQLASRAGMKYGIHFCFDDGIFPIDSDVRMLYECPDTTTLDTLARVPFSAENPQEFLQFPHRLNQSLATDFVATIVMAHWPRPEPEGYDLLLRMARRSSLFGTFETLSQYFENTEPTGMSSPVQNDQYLSPFLLSDELAQKPDLVSRYPRQHRHWARLNQLSWIASAGSAIRPGFNDKLPKLDAIYEQLSAGNLTDDEITELERQYRSEFAKLFAGNQSGEKGTLAINSLGSTRQILDRAAGSVLNTPAMGYFWRSDGSESDSGVTVDAYNLANQHLKIAIHPESGFIRSLQPAAVANPILAQRIEVVGVPGDVDSGYDSQDPGGNGDLKPKAVMKARSVKVIAAGGEVGSVRAEGELIVDPVPNWAKSEVLAKFVQTVTLRTESQFAELSIQISDLVEGALSSSSGAWHSYLACRFAWPDPGSIVVPAMGTVAAPSKSPRPETPLFYEIHSQFHRGCVLTGGLPFHKKIGKRMIDTILITPSEQQRSFEVGIGIDLPNPFRSAMEFVSPETIIPNTAEPGTGPSGWLFHLDARNVVISSMHPLGSKPGVQVRLYESEGLSTNVRLRSFRPIKSARVTDLLGNFVADVTAEGDSVSIDLMSHEFTQLELEFA